jgi:hypothetical protein
MDTLGRVRVGWRRRRGVGGCWVSGNALGASEWALVVPRGSRAVSRRVFIPICTTARLQPMVGQSPRILGRFTAMTDKQTRPREV